MSELVEFLLARIAEDEEIAQEAINDLDRLNRYEAKRATRMKKPFSSEFPPFTALEWFDSSAGTLSYEGEPNDVETRHIRNWSPYRVLIDSHWRRSIIDAHPMPSSTPHNEVVLELMAQVYSDHADFDPSWRMQ